MVYVGTSKDGRKLHIARFPWKPGPAWCGAPITSKVQFKLNADDPDVCRLCLRKIDSHLAAKYGDGRRHPRREKKAAHGAVKRKAAHGAVKRKAA